MSEKVAIEPKYITDFIEFLGVATYHKYGGKGSEKPWPKMKREEKEALRGTVNLVAHAITKGLILAKRQPELADAHIQQMNEMRPGYADELLKDVLWQYQQFLYMKLREEGWTPPGAPKR